MNRQAAAQSLIDATLAVAAGGVPLMTRILPAGGGTVWDHYPPHDAVDPASGARWFYHAHPPGERAEGEHGHFHLFLDRRLFRRASPPLAGPPRGRADGANVVHVVAVAIDLQGLPFRLFTVNRWVTDEWLYPAAEIARRLPRFDLSSAPGDPLVNRWLAAAARFFAPDIVQLLHERDRVLAALASADRRFEDRTAEVLSARPCDVNQALVALDGA